MFTVLHVADCHFANKPDMLEEVVRTTNAIAKHAVAAPPDIAILAGDTLDEHIGAIRIDSDAARAAISFVTRLAEVCPVCIVRGTRSHDRESPYIFQHLKSRFPIYVGTQFKQVSLLKTADGPQFMPYVEAAEGYGLLTQAVLTLLPSPDKANVISAFGGDSKQIGTLATKEAMFDLLSLMGNINAQVPEPIPRIAIGHGMISGVVFSSGTVSTGEDLEYSLSDLALLNCDLKCYGHIHLQQSFPGNTHYSGSPGRLNFGEKEDKGFLVHKIENRAVETVFFSTPARYFVFSDYDWQAGIDCGHLGDMVGQSGFDMKLKEAVAEIKEHPGCDARFRCLSIPEEERHFLPSRSELEQTLVGAGARSAKVEYSILPQMRTRAAGISRKETLVDKIIMFGETTGTTIPERTLELAGIIEGMEVNELIELAKKACGEA
jgi:exonuclease SbcD